MIKNTGTCVKLIFIIMVSVSLNTYAQLKINLIQQKELDSLIVTTKENDIIKLNDLYEKSKKNGYWESEQKLSILIGEHYFNTLKLDSSLYFLNISESILRTKNIKDSRAAVVYQKKGIVYKDLSLLGKSLNYTYKAHDLYRRLGNDKMLYQLKMDIAHLHREMRDHEKSIAIANEILDNDKFLDEKLKLKAYISIANCYFNEKNYKNSIKFYQKGLNISTADSSHHGQLIALGNMTATYNNIQDYNSALKTLKKFDSVIEHLDDLKSKYLGHRNHSYGEAYLGLKKYALAEVHLLQSLDLAKQNSNIIYTYGTLSDLYKEQNEWKNAFVYERKRFNILDSIYNQEKVEIAKNADLSYRLMEEEYDSDLLKKENHFLAEQNKQQRRFTIVISFLGLFSLLIIFLFFKYKRKKNEVKILKANEKKILENQIMDRENELSATLMYFNNKMLDLKRINTEFGTIIKEDSDPLVKKIRKSLEAFIRSNTDIKLLTERIENQFPGITAQLKTIHPNLSPNDIKHCLLVKLGMSIKDSSALLNVSREAVKMARIRIKKKMKLPSNQLLSDYLNEITSEAKKDLIKK